MTIRIPYMRINQKNEIFYLTKMKFTQLKNTVKFHFRQAYSNTTEDRESYYQHIETLYRKGIEVESKQDGIQRQLKLKKINEIKDYLNNLNDDCFFPNTVILSADLSEDDEFMSNYTDIEEKEIGFIELPDTINFEIVDGQHRLAGLFLADTAIQENFEIPIVLLLNITRHTCAKVFVDVNGNQTTVNKSLIYDLNELIDDPNGEDAKLHTLCKNFNSDETSPLYLHVKMLGIGYGAISQAFFVQTLKNAISKTDLSYSNIQNIYNNIYYYLKCFQRIYQDQWPVLEGAETNSEKFTRHSRYVLIENKSQILKTNGFGAIMEVFPIVYKNINEKKFSSYFDMLKRLDNKDKIDWFKNEIVTQGTSKKAISAIKDLLLDQLGLKDTL